MISDEDVLRWETRILKGGDGLRYMESLRLIEGFFGLQYREKVAMRALEIAVPQENIRKWAIEKAEEDITNE